MSLVLQEAALAAADSVDPLAQRIGAVNTLVRQVQPAAHTQAISARHLSADLLI